MLWFTSQSVRPGRKAMEELANSGGVVNGRRSKGKFPLRSLSLIRISMRSWSMAIQGRVKMMRKPAKFSAADLPVTATTVRVPLFLQTSGSSNVETYVKPRPRKTGGLREAPGIIVERRAGEQSYRWHARRKGD